MTSKSETIVARYYGFLKAVFGDLDEMDQRDFWKYLGTVNARYTEPDTIPPTWEEKLIAFDGENSA